MSEYMTLTELYGDEPPDKEELIWQAVGRGKWNTKFKVVRIDVVEYVSVKHGDESLLEQFERVAKAWQKKLVERYARNAASLAKTTYLVVDSSSEEVIDGQHRVVAFYLAGVKQALALDLSQEEGVEQNPPKGWRWTWGQTALSKKFLDEWREFRERFEENDKRGVPANKFSKLMLGDILADDILRTEAREFLSVRLLWALSINGRPMRGAGVGLMETGELILALNPMATRFDMEWNVAHEIKHMVDKAYGEGADSLAVINQKGHGAYKRLPCERRGECYALKHMKRLGWIVKDED